MNDEQDVSEREVGIHSDALWQKQLDLERFSGGSLFGSHCSKRLYSPVLTYERYRNYDIDHSRLTRPLTSTSLLASSASRYTRRMSLPHKTFMNGNSAVMTQRVILPYSVFCPFTRQFIRPNSNHYAFLQKCGFAAVPNICSGVEVKLMQTLQLYHAYCTIHRYNPVFQHSHKASTEVNVKNDYCIFKSSLSSTESERFSRNESKVMEEPLSWGEYLSNTFTENKFMTNEFLVTQSKAYRPMSVYTALTKLTQTSSAMDFETFCSSVVPQIRRYTNTWRNRTIEIMWQPYFINLKNMSIKQTNATFTETCIANTTTHAYHMKDRANKNNYCEKDSSSNNKSSGSKKPYNVANVHTSQHIRPSIWCSDYTADRVAWRLSALQLLRKWHVQGQLNLPCTTWPLLRSAMHNVVEVGDADVKETNETLCEVNSRSTQHKNDMTSCDNEQIGSKEENRNKTVKMEQWSDLTQDALPMLNLPQYTRIAFLHIPYKDCQVMHINRSEYNSSKNSTMDMMCKELLLQLSRQYHDLCTPIEKTENSNKNRSGTADKSNEQSTTEKLYYCPLEHCVDYNGVLDLVAFLICTEADIERVMRQPSCNNSGSINKTNIDSSRKENERVVESVPLLSLGVNVIHDNCCALRKIEIKKWNRSEYNCNINISDNNVLSEKDSYEHRKDENAVKHVVVFSNSHFLSKGAIVRLMNQWSENMITSKKIEMSKKWRRKKVEHDQVVRLQKKELTESQAESNCVNVASTADNKPESMSQTNAKDEHNWWTKVTGNEEERNDNNALELKQQQQQQYKRHVTCFYDHPFGHVQALFVTYTFQSTVQNSNTTNKQKEDDGLQHWVDLCAYKQCENVQQMQCQRKLEKEQKQKCEEECGGSKLQFSTEPSQCVFYLQETLAGALLRMSRLYTEKLKKEQHTQFLHELYECTCAAVSKKDETVKRHLACRDETNNNNNSSDEKKSGIQGDSTNNIDNCLYINKMIVSVMPLGKRIEKERQVYLSSPLGLELWVEGCNTLLLHATCTDNDESPVHNCKVAQCMSERVPVEKIQQILLTYPFLTSIHTRHIMVNAFALRFVGSKCDRNTSNLQHSSISRSTNCSSDENDNDNTQKKSTMMMAVKLVKSRTEAANVERIAFDSLRHAIRPPSSYLHYLTHKTINTNKNNISKRESVKGRCDREDNNDYKTSLFDCNIKLSSVQYQRYTNYIEPVLLLGQWTRSFYVRVRHSTNLVAWRTTIRESLTHECTHEFTLHEAQVVIDDVDVFHVDMLALDREHFEGVYGIRALYHETTTSHSISNVNATLSRILHNLLYKQYYEWQEQRVWCIAPYQMNRHIAKDWDVKVYSNCNKRNSSSTHHTSLQKGNKVKEHKSLLDYTCCYLFDSSDDSRSAWSPMLTERRLLALCAVQRPVLELAIGAHVFLYMPLITFYIINENNKYCNNNMNIKKVNKDTSFCTVTLPAKTICTIVGFIHVDDVLEYLSLQVEELAAKRENKVQSNNEDDNNSNNKINMNDNESSDGKSDPKKKCESKATSTSTIPQKKHERLEYEEYEEEEEEMEIKSWQKRIEEIKQYMYHQKNVYTLPLIKVNSIVECEFQQQCLYEEHNLKKYKNATCTIKQSSAVESSDLRCLLLLPMCSLIGGYRSLHYYSMPVLHLPVHLLLSSDANSVTKTSCMPRSNLANLLLHRQSLKQLHLAQRAEKYHHQEHELMKTNKPCKDKAISVCVCLPVNTLFHPYFTFPECKAWMCLTAAQRYAAYLRFIQLCRQQQNQLLPKKEKEVHKYDKTISGENSALNLFMFVEHVMLDDDFGTVSNSIKTTNFGTGVNASISTKTLKLSSEGNYLWHYASCSDLEEEEYNLSLNYEHPADEDIKDETESSNVADEKNKCKGNSEDTNCGSPQPNVTNKATTTTTSSSLTLQETHLFDASKLMIIKKQSLSCSNT